MRFFRYLALFPYLLPIIFAVESIYGIGKSANGAPNTRFLFDEPEEYRKKIRAAWNEAETMYRTTSFRLINLADFLQSRVSGSALKRIYFKFMLSVTLRTFNAMIDGQSSFTELPEEHTTYAAPEKVLQSIERIRYMAGVADSLANNTKLRLHILPGYKPLVTLTTSLKWLGPVDKYGRRPFYNGFDERRGIKTSRRKWLTLPRGRWDEKPPDEEQHDELSSPPLSYIFPDMACHSQKPPSCIIIALNPTLMKEKWPDTDPDDSGSYAQYSSDWTSENEPELNLIQIRGRYMSSEVITLTSQIPALVGKDTDGQPRTPMTVMPCSPDNPDVDGNEDDPYSWDCVTRLAKHDPDSAKTSLPNFVLLVIALAMEYQDFSSGIGKRLSLQAPGGVKSSGTGRGPGSTGPAQAYGSEQEPEHDSQYDSEGGLGNEGTPQSTPFHSPTYGRYAYTDAFPSIEGPRTRQNAAPSPEGDYRWSKKRPSPEGPAYISNTGASKRPRLGSSQQGGSRPGSMRLPAPLPPRPPTPNPGHIGEGKGSQDVQANSQFHQLSDIPYRPTPQLEAANAMLELARGYREHQGGGDVTNTQLEGSDTEDADLDSDYGEDPGMDTEQAESSQDSLDTEAYDASSEDESDTPGRTYSDNMGSPDSDV